MKLNPNTVNQVEEMINKRRPFLLDDFWSNSFFCGLYYKTYGKRISQRELRAALQELRCSGRIRCLIASGRGYKFTNVTAEIETYLKRLHKKAMQDLHLYSAIKQQAEHDLGMQIDLKFYSELYEQAK